MKKKKKFFTRSDGTIILAPVLLVITVVLSFLLFLLFRSLMGNGGRSYSDSTSDITYGSQDITTTTILLCNDCSLGFVDNNIKVSVNGKLDLSEIIKLNKINIQNVEFKVDDEAYMYVKEKGSTKFLFTNDKVGTHVLTASYLDKSAKINIEIDNSTPNRYEFVDDDYYIRLKTTYEITKKDINIYPYGKIIDDVTYTSDTKNIRITKQNIRCANSFMHGVVTLHAPNGFSDSMNVYCVPNLINVKVLNNDGNKEYKKYYVGNNEEINIEISFSDLYNKKYNNNDLKINSYNATGNLNASISYVGIDGSAARSYKYKILVNKDASVGSSETFEISLPDESVFYFTLYK